MISLLDTKWEVAGIQTVLLDKDGTLIDANVYWGKIIEIRASLLNKTYSIPINALQYIMGYDFLTRKLLPEGPVGVCSRAVVIDTLLASCKQFYGVSLDKAEVENIFDQAYLLFQKEMLSYIKILPGVERLIYTLYRDHVKIGVVTSDSTESTYSILHFLHLAEYIDIVVGRESHTAAKETGAPCMFAMEQLHVNPKTTITIGDSPIDIIMGNKCGCLAGVGVTTGQTNFSTLSKYSAFVTSSLSNLVVDTRR